jgi:hypothetical protein
VKANGEIEVALSKQTSLLFCGGATETNGGSQQFNGREGETATFLSHCPLNFNTLLRGFAPR